MKRILHPTRWSLAIVACMAVLLSTNSLLAQTPRPYTNIVVETFDDFLSPALFTLDNGPSGTIFDWSEEDADGNPSSGSVYCRAEWVDTSLIGDPNDRWQEVQLGAEDALGGWPGRPMAPYYQVEFDIKVLSGNPDTNGTYGLVQIVCQGWNGAGANNGQGWVPLGGVDLTTSGTWQHVTQVLTPFQLNNLNKFVLNFVGSYVTNTVEYLVDNIEFTLPTGPPPTLGIAEAEAAGGLTLLTAGTQYSRENIRTIDTNFSWYAAAGPVTYSFTIAENPPEPYTGYQTHFWLVVNAPAASTSFADYSAANVLRFDVNNSTNGTGSGSLRYKTNSPNNNGGYYTDVSAGGGQYPAVPSTSVLGTWSLTFNQNTNVTVMAPDGTSSNYVLSADAAAWFDSSNVRFYVGAMANQVGNSGQRAILTSVEITGAGGGLSDAFPGPDINPALWEKSATTPDNVFILPSDVAYNVSWSRPDNLFRLSTGEDVDNLSNAGLPVVVGGSENSVIVPKNFPGADQGYFALAKREPVKLQVLLPGETGAPGTPTGKEGTPNTQTAGVPFEVVVNAVDDDWNVTFLSDEVYLESPGDTNFGFVFLEELVNGTATYTVTNLTSGSQTIRALDTSDTNVLEYVTGSYTVNP